MDEKYLVEKYARLEELYPVVEVLGRYHPSSQPVMEELAYLRKGLTATLNNGNSGNKRLIDLAMKVENMLGIEDVVYIGPLN